jgi:short-subunit dehydrogenase
MARSIKDKIVLITGASAGIGFACASTFADAGARVVLVARGEERLNAAVAHLRTAGGRAEGIVADVGTDAGCDHLLDTFCARYDSLDILINNAGLHHRGLYAAVDADALADMIRVNLQSPIRLTRKALDLLIPSQGAIINVASLAGCIPVPYSATYSASKFGLRAFSLALRVELLERKVSVSCVSPGPVNTGFIMDNLDDVTDITLSQPMVTAGAVADAVMACARDGKAERKLPKASGWLATIGYLFPWLRVCLQPILEKKGARVKAELIAKRLADTTP